MRRGAPSTSLNLLMASFAENTLNQYNSSLKKWWYFCQDNHYNYCEASVSQVIQFFTESFETGASYSTLNTMRSALSLLLDPSVTSNIMITRLLKGVFRLKPPTPKYDVTWDPIIVLNYLSDFYPYDNICLRDLSAKTVTLLAIASAQRMQTLSLIKITNIVIESDCVIIKITDLIKTSRPGAYQPLIRLPFIIENPKICPALALTSYMNKTLNIRNCESGSLFISFRKPHNKVGPQTLAHWVKSTLQKSGIDTNIFGAHSTRHAATSAARRAGVSLQVVRRAAGWSDSSNVFLKYYNRDVNVCATNNEFANSVFNHT
ncbi:uncharacterized protein LOC114365605 [Ostrinia furnacalis]|uniref:uncharacterized protein LOC114365605 n=1 Tax=Ostrinia furnacalis TaxID=93504 RepID=UPI00103C3379|nr:uncharacterized protein LOC114365605 [Ostrinia furnacalis]